MVFKSIKKMPKLTLTILAIAIGTAAVLGYFIYRGRQPEVYALLAWGNQSSPTTQDAANSLLQTAISQGLDANSVMASKSQLKDALEAGCSFCAYGWCSSDSQNIYGLNQLSSGTDCGTQSSSLTVVSPSDSGNIACFVYGIKPSPSSALSYETVGNNQGIMPWQWGVYSSGPTNWSQYTPRISL